MMDFFQQNMMFQIVYKHGIRHFSAKLSQGIGSIKKHN